MRHVSLLVALLIPGFPAWGQEDAKRCVEGKPDHCVQPLAAGEVAPFSGQLYTPELAFDHAEKVHSFDVRLKLELDRAQQIFDVKLDHERRLREIDAEAAAQREKIYEKELEGAAPPFYERPAFVIPITVVVTAAVILTVFALAAEYGQFLWVPQQP